MYARSTTITGDASRIDELIAYVRDDVMPTITAMDGSVGLSLLVDRESGRCIATSSWTTEEARDTSFEQLAAQRTKGGEILGGAVQTDNWEIALMHREHGVAEGSCCRVTWAQFDPSGTDRGIDYFRDTVLPAAENLQGFGSASLMVDRSTGRSCVTSVYDSRAALEASREAASKLRDAAASDVGFTFLDIAEFEVAYAHLRVPEQV